MLVYVCVISKDSAVHTQDNIHHLIGDTVLMQTVQIITPGCEKQSGGVFHLIHILYVSHSRKNTQGAVGGNYR